METDTPVETLGKQRWVVLAASFWSLLLTGYGQYNTGVMKVALISHWQSDVFTTTWLASLYAGCYALTAPLGCLLINLVNCRACVVLSGVLCLVGYVLSSVVTDDSYLFFTLVLVGIGQGMSNAGSLVILGYYFPDKTNIVTGVSITGGAVGIFIHPPLLQVLVDWYGLRGAFLLSGAVAFHSCACGALMKPAKIEKRVTQSRRQGNVVQRVCHVIRDACSDHIIVLTTWSLLTILLSVFVFSLSAHILMVQLPAYLISQSGLTPTEAAFSISVYGIGSLISRFLTGFIAHDPRIGNRLVYCGLMGIHVFVSLAAPLLLTEGIVGAYVYLFMVGLYSGGCFSLPITLAYDVVSIHHFSTAFGLLQFCIGLGALVGAPISERVYKNEQNPYILFGFVAALFFVSTVLGSLVTSAPASKATPQSPLSEKQFPASGDAAVDDDDDGDKDSGKIPEHEKLLSDSLTAKHTIEDSAEEVELLTIRNSETDHQEATGLTMDSSPPQFACENGKDDEQFPQNVAVP